MPAGQGGVAQLGERLNGIQEVMGSTPTVSMEKTAKIRGFFVAKMADAVKNVVNGKLFRV